MATKTTTLNLRIGPKMKEQLQFMADREEMSLAEVVRYILAEHLREARFP